MMAIQISMDAPLIIHILAGGSSQRMGADKRHLLLQNVSMLDWCRLTAEGLGCPVNIIKEDQRQGHGPLGGIETGLMHSGSAFHLFLSCDMPFVSEQTLKDLIAITQDHQTVVCMEDKGRRGFPLVVPDHFLPLVKSQLDQGRRSLYSLFHHSESVVFCWKEEDRMESMNVNTQEEFSLAEHWVESRNLKPPVTFRHADLMRLPNPE
jgi:molybdopterin-guanine dinucleotide biosynthesis protein A